MDRPRNGEQSKNVATSTMAHLRAGRESTAPSAGRAPPLPPGAPLDAPHGPEQPSVLIAKFLRSCEWS